MVSAGVELALRKGKACGVEVEPAVAPRPLQAGWPSVRTGGGRLRSSTTADADIGWFSACVTGDGGAIASRSLLAKVAGVGAGSTDGEGT